MCREVASGTVHDNVYFTTETGKEIYEYGK